MGFNDFPTSRAEFREQACRAAQNNLFDDTAENNGTGGWIYNNEAESIAAWMLGAQLSAGETEGNLLPFSKAENLDALQFILDLYRDDCAWTGKESIPFGYFSRRYALFYSGTSEDIFTQNNFQINEESSDDWILIPYPGQEGGSVFLINGYSAALFTSEVNEMRAALEFIRWIFQEDVQASIVENSGAFPISNAVYQAVDADWELFPVWEPMIGYLPFGKNVNRIENWMLVEKILEDLGWQLVQYNIQPAMVESLLERADELIAEYE